jgi:hypothetical protein
MNRCIRGPYVQWCERRTPSVSSGGAVYSITSWRSVVCVVKVRSDKGFAVCYCFCVGSVLAD